MRGRDEVDRALDGDSVMSQTAELRRIDFTGTFWFGAAVIAIGLSIGGLLAAGWRPSDLPAIAGIVWWIATAIAALSTVALAWAGCPVFGTDAGSADRQKSLCIRFGVGLFLAGWFVALGAVLLTPTARPI